MDFYCFNHKVSSFEVFLIRNVFWNVPSVSVVFALGGRLGVQCAVMCGVERSPVPLIPSARSPAPQSKIRNATKNRTPAAVPRPLQYFTACILHGKLKGREKSAPGLREKANHKSVISTDLCLHLADDFASGEKAFIQAEKHTARLFN
jgi:hypothetical protein